MAKFLGKAFLVIAIIVAVIYFGAIYLIKKDAQQLDNNISGDWMNEIEQEISNEDETEEFVEGGDSTQISVLATMRDEIKKNSTWCGTMQLVWNDMLDEVLKEVPTFTNENETILNLNKKIFTINDLSEEYYYKKFGYKTLDLKAEIEKGIKDKFNETSDVLDQIDWSKTHQPGSGVSNYLFYSMLKREFKFIEKFDILENARFKDTEDVTYFGIDDETEQKVKDQIDVLYYEDYTDFGFKVATKNKDTLIVIRKDDFESSFEKILYTAINRAKDYEGSKKLEEEDTLKIPDLDFKVQREYKEVENNMFFTSQGQGMVNQAIQTIEMTLDSEGGKVKSEAVMSMMFTSAIEPGPIKKPRNFLCNGEFVIFLIEEGREKPYFAVKIDDIELFQKK